MHDKRLEDKMACVDNRWGVMCMRKMRRMRWGCKWNERIKEQKNIETQSKKMIPLLHQEKSQKIRKRKTIIFDMNDIKKRPKRMEEK